MAIYPDGIPTFAVQQDGIDTVNALDVNSAYTEITAIAATLGNKPHIRDVSWSTNAYNTSTEDFTTIDNRIRNVEDGVQVITGSAVTSTGNKTITVASNSHVGLTVQAKSGQTGNLLTLANSSGTAVTEVNSSGYIVVIDGGTA